MNKTKNDKNKIKVDINYNRVTVMIFINNRILIKSINKQMLRAKIMIDQTIKR